ncbi:MAG: peptide chain release factor 2 [Candidatus Levybacteria bacterium]|nr:peptide chain release factor 2 [Candidatus Levybacteria bacterium]
MEDLKKRAEIVLEKLNIEDKERRFREIEALSSVPEFWKDTQNASKLMQEMSLLQKEINSYKKIKELVVNERFEELEEPLKDIEVYLYLSGPLDKSNAIVSIHAGQGGVDAMDWAEMLSRMYQRYFERKGYKFEVIDRANGEEAGIKYIDFLVEGEYAYGYLKNENGTHRMVRLSPFNANNLRQTSFALVEVLPQTDDDTTIKINEDDLEWDFYRASSHGGQNVQKVSSAVRVTHKPSGIIVTCQTERYQNQNREYALKMLKAKLLAKAERERILDEKKLKGDYKPASWGNQIRNYVLHPYKMVKDVRTQVETGNTEAVLDGDIDIFIEAGLKELH